MNYVGQIWVTRANFWVLVLAVRLHLVFSALTWSALLRPHCQLKRQVAGTFSVFGFSLVWSDLG